MTFTEIRQRYPRVTDILISAFLAGACGLTVTQITSLLNLQLHQHTIFAISFALFFLIDSYKKYRAEWLQRDPRSISIFITTICALFVMGINTLMPLNLSSESIRLMAWTIYIVCIVFIPVRYPQYREATGNQTIEKKLKDMHG